MPVTARAATEYGTLRRVAMRYAGDVSRNLDGPDVHPVLARQKATSAWAPYTPAKVRAQQDTLISLLRERGTEVVILPEAPGCSTQHYPRDIGFVIDDVLFAARLNSAHRLPEAEALADLTAAMSNVAQLAAGTIEGGDVMLHDECVLVGLSEETSTEGAPALQAALAQHRIDRDVACRATSKITTGAAFTMPTTIPANRTARWVKCRPSSARRRERPVVLHFTTGLARSAWVFVRPAPLAAYQVHVPTWAMYRVTLRSCRSQSPRCASARTCLICR